MSETIIIGGGAAGLLAACFAARKGDKTTVIERNDRVGRKLSITGKGRCNLTNACSREEFFENVPTNPRFMYSSFSAFDNYSVMSFFEDECGIPLKTERGNRVFPQSDRAADITSALERTAKERGARIVQGRVTSLIIEDGAVKGVETHKGKWAADKVIIATGGMSYPKTGSTGDGYELAKQAGHRIVPPRPSLVPLEIKQKFCAEAMGLSLRNVYLSLWEKDKRIFGEQGEMLFTHFGVSGPLVLTASGHIRDVSIPHRLTIDLKPALDEKTLNDRILRDFAMFTNRDLINALNKLLPSKIIPVVVGLSGIAPDTKVNQISREQRMSLLRVIKCLEMDVKGFRPIDEAIITSGGVDTSQIDPKTMQSKLCSGLYFAGEVIDVDAYTGGFNLQIAFSTAYAAAK